MQEMDILWVIELIPVKEQILALLSGEKAKPMVAVVAFDAAFEPRALLFTIFSGL